MQDSNMKWILSIEIVFTLLLFAGCQNQRKPGLTELEIIGYGQMPNIVNDKSGTIHLTFGRGDSILFTSSKDGNTFSPPVLVAVLPELAASHTRGPQIANTDYGITIIACNKQGNIFTYYKVDSDKWVPGARVNDVDTTSKEGLMALSGGGQNLYAVWLDLRDKHNKIFGAGSTDGGKSWSRNILVYESPDTTVCECCKPSVLVVGNTVNVMFRNWLNGNRDLYLIQSVDRGLTFAAAQKLGNESWALNGCPMDGGAIALDEQQQIQSVWNRKGKIYSCEPGKPEIEIGEGRGCTITSKNNQNAYAWVEKGEIVCLLPFAGKKKLGKGQSPVISSINDKQIICIWENEKKIYIETIDL